jgi:hypothetical protein
MTLKEFAQQFEVKGWKKALSLAIEKHVPDGRKIMDEGAAAVLACRHRGSAENQLRLKHAMMALRHARQQVIDIYQLHIDA